MLERLRKGKGEQGFTLIELLIVIIILGILAAIVVFAVGGITDRGQLSACDTDKKTLQTAEEANYAKLASYTTEAGLVANGRLAEPSILHDITTTPPASLTATAYTVTAIAPCT